MTTTPNILAQLQPLAVIVWDDARAGLSMRESLRRYRAAGGRVRTARYLAMWRVALREQARP